MSDRTHTTVWLRAAQMIKCSKPTIMRRWEAVQCAKLAQEKQ